MSDAAHVGPHTHPVFNMPLKVTVKTESWDTPANYKDRRLPNEPKVPDKIAVWRVQNSGKSYGSVVARKYGFMDSPDTEIIVEGFNSGKEYGAVGIGRHGNFLQWGFSQPPSKMTEAGRRLFVNCICYIKQFDGKAPLVRRQSSHRDNALRLAALITQIKNEDFFRSTFSAELQDKYKGNPKGLVQYYLTDYELIYRNRAYLIDKELKSLGIDSNRKVESLETLIALLTRPEKASTAQILLERYTTESFSSLIEWQQWFDENRERFYFTDVGGYKFRIIPKGYLETSESAQQPAQIMD